MSTAATAPRTELLVVDDDRGLAETLRSFLAHEGYAVEIALKPEEALDVLQRNPGLAAALVDLVMPVTDGLALMERLHERSPRLPVVIMTGFGTIETAVEAMKRGAEDYITKPFDKEAVRKKIGRLMEVQRLRQRVERLESDLERARNSFGSLVHVSDAVRSVIDQARAVAASDVPVLILGETGTGKEMLARAIHDASPRGGGPFLGVNCGALPHDLVESELFGARKGAFTGAVADKPGIFLAAHHGTVFLDEIGDMPREAQVKLLRVLQEKEIRALGAVKPVSVDVRIIAATNRPLAQLPGGCLREDLYFRLATVILEMPPLRRRPSDIPVLARHFVAQLSQRYKREVLLPQPVIDEMLLYEFPGNVRELQSLLERDVARSTGDPVLIDANTFCDLRLQMARARSDSAGPGPVPPADLPPLLPGESAYSLQTMERLTIARALQVCKGNRTRAALLLGISRDTLYRKMREFNLMTVDGARAEVEEA